MTQDTTQQISRNILQIEEYAINNGFALALPRNHYYLSDSDQHQLLAEAYDTLIEFFGGFGRTPNMIPSDYDKAGINTMREEDNRKQEKVYLELF